MCSFGVEFTAGGVLLDEAGGEAGGVPCGVPGEAVGVGEAGGGRRWPVRV